MSAAVLLPWEAHLDAFEEWLRRTAASLDDRDGLDVPVLSSAPEGPLPEQLRQRAAVALQQLARVEQAAFRRREELTRAQAYSHY